MLGAKDGKHFALGKNVCVAGKILLVKKNYWSGKDNSHCRRITGCKTITGWGHGVLKGALPSGFSACFAFYCTIRSRGALRVLLYPG